MSYLVLARKFRPQLFEEVVGQEHITTTLKNALLADRVAHAYLFTGPRGVGKTTTARIFAKALNCKKGPTITPCNECPSCKDITVGSSMDVIEIDGASNRGIDEIRQLRENVKFAASGGKYKIYIIDEVHMLTTEAFNALLKTLEEPPAHVKFIFATTAVYKVPATILSRCQRFDFIRICTKDIAKTLEKICGQQGWRIEQEALYAIAEAADGSLRDSQSLLDQMANFCGGTISYLQVKQVLGLVGDERFFDIIRAVKARDAAGLIMLVNDLFNQGVDPVPFLQGFADFLRNMLVAIIGGPALKTIEKPQEYLVRLGELAKSFSEHDVLYFLHLVLETRNMLKKTDQGTIAIEMLMVKMTLKEDLTSLESILSELSQWEEQMKKRPEVSSSVMHGEKKVSFSAQVAHEIIGQTCAEGAPFSRDVTVDKMVKPPGIQTGDIHQVWPRVVEAVKQQKRSCGVCLEDARVCEYTSTHLRIGFPEHIRFHKDMIDTKANRELIEQTLSTYAGTPLRLMVEVLPEEGASVPMESPTHAHQKKHEVITSPTVNKLLTLFEGQIRDVEP